MNKKVSIIILNWNGWKDTIECLESLYQITYKNYDVIVVDNGSEDESITKIKEYCEGKIKVESKFFKYDESNKPIKIIELTREYSVIQGKESELDNIDSIKKLLLIKNEKNYGFAEGNNIGIRYALKAIKPKYICLLNNDTIVDPLFLSKLINAFENNNEIGSLQSLLLRHDGVTIDSLGQKLMGNGDAKDIKIGEKYVNSMIFNLEIFGACAASAIYRVDILKKVGLFDGNYFIIFEDVDLSWRIQLAGYSSFLVPISIVYHKRGISGKKVNCNVLYNDTIYYSCKNSIMNLIKYYPIYSIIKHLLIILYRVVIIIYFAVKKRELQMILKECIKNIKIRKKNLLSYRLKETQKKWIEE